MSCFCNPVYTVISVTATATIVTYTVDKLFTSIGLNAPLRILINRAQVPTNSTAQVQFTDGTTTYNAQAGCTGNYLRADALRKFMRCHKCALFNCFLGNDPAHIQVNHRFCPSEFLAAQEATDPGVGASTETVVTQ